MKTTVVVALLLLSMVTPMREVLAQRGMNDEKARERIEEYRRVKLIEVLDLDEEQAVRLLAREKDFKKQEDERAKQHDELLEQLKSMLKSDAGDEELMLQIQKLSEFSMTAEKVRHEYMLSLRDILDVQQLAKMVLFQKRFQDEIKRMIIDRARGPKRRR